MKLEQITKAQAVRDICAGNTAFLYTLAFSPVQLAEYIRDNKAVFSEYITRKSKPYSKGILFDTGSYLQLYGCNENIECYRAVLEDITVIIIFGGYYCNAYIVMEG